MSNVECDCNDMGQCRLHKAMDKLEDMTVDADVASLEERFRELKDQHDRLKDQHDRLQLKVDELKDLVNQLWARSKSNYDD